MRASPKGAAPACPAGPLRDVKTGIGRRARLRGIVPTTVPPDPFAAALRDALARGEGPAGTDGGGAGQAEVPIIATHLSWVLLAGAFAFKLKRPVRLPFVDFTTPEARRAACDEELRVNRRLAPGLYLDVVPVFGTRAAPRWRGAPGEAPIDHAVRMRRFDDDALLSRRLAAGRLAADDIDRLAARLGAFHRDAPARRDALVPPERTAAALVAQVLAGPDGAPLADARSTRLRDWARAESLRLAPRFREREAAGAVRDGHGDLHLENLVASGGDVTAFDAIEFDAGLRRIDVIADLAFATMDLAARGRRDLAFRLLDRWLAFTGEFDGLRVLRFHEVCRALVRALAARLAPERAAGGPDYLAHALGLVDGAAPRLALMHGFSGSGKSVLAGALVERWGAVRVRADVERKRLAGLAAGASSAAAGLSLYVAASTARTYARLLDAARAGLDGGYPVIVDATFLRRAARDAFRAEAAARGVPFVVLDCVADADTLRERVARRARQGGDASEADLAVLERQMRESIPFDEDERADVRTVDTTRPGVRSLRDLTPRVRAADSRGRGQVPERPDPGVPDDFDDADAARNPRAR
jgi:hypothetical protein